MSRDSATVSNNMRKIHSKDTSIELLLRKALWHKGYRYRKNYKALPGSPDIVLTKYKIAIFCDSEFFHGKNWEILKLRLEKGKNPDFWIKKIERNRNRDYENVGAGENSRKNSCVRYYGLRRAVLSFTSGDKTFPNIQMNVYKPLKKPFGIQNFLIQPLTMIYLKNNPSYT